MRSSLNRDKTMVVVNDVFSLVCCFSGSGYDAYSIQAFYGSSRGRYLTVPRSYCLIKRLSALLDWRRVFILSTKQANICS